MFKSHPDPSEWDDYVDYESTSWPRKDRRHYWIIPSICFNCESACGVLAYVDKETLKRAPGFDKNQWPNMSDRTWGEEIYSHYGYSPYWE